MKIENGEIGTMNFIDQYKIKNDDNLSKFTKQQKLFLGMMCIERQFKTYEVMAEGRSWNRSSDYRFILNECWESILSEKNLEERIWEAHEQIKPESIEVDIKERNEQAHWFYCVFAGNVESYIDDLIEGNEYAGTVRLLNLDFILQHLNDDNNQFLYDEYEDNGLIQNELKNQKMDEERVLEIKSYDDAVGYYGNCDRLF